MRGPTGALHGLRVIELASIGPGPMACMLLADHGADVVRVDRLRASGLGLAMEPRHDVHARSRRSIALDLKHPDGIDALLRLLDTADLLVEGFRPGVLEGLGLAPQRLLERNPRLVIGRVTGFGQTGPLAQAAGHDLNFVALSGALHGIGTAEQPLPPLNLVGDYGGGALFLAFGMLAALFERQRSGLGQVVDAAMVDGAASLAGIFFGLQAAGSWVGERQSNLLDGGAPFYATYATADGRHVALAALEPKFFAELARRIGLDERFVQGQHERSLWPAMRQAIAAIIATRSRDAWCGLLEGSDACFAPVLGLDEAPQHAHARARAAFVGVDGVQQPAPAPRLGRSGSRTPQPAPQPGQHTREVLQEAGLDAAAVQQLLDSGVAAVAPAG